MRILAVDDTKENLYMLEAMLKGGGHQVISATNGVEALEKLGQDGIEMIISDILMPKMDGFQLCMKCKGDEKLRVIPFILTTSSYTEAKDEEFAMSLGADMFLVRPIDPGEFLKLIKEVAGKKGGAAPQRITKEDSVFLKQYSERLLSKLEEKMMELEGDINKRKEAEAGLKKKMGELEVFHKSAVGRELKMVDLESEVNRLLREMGQEPKYKEL